MPRRRKNITKSASRTRQVKTKVNEEAKKRATTFSEVRREYFQNEKIIRGRETFTATSHSSIAAEDRPVLTDGTSNSRWDDVKAVICSDEASNEDPRMEESCTSKCTLISFESPSDQPILVPRPRLSSKDTIDFSDLNQPLTFILKTPKYLPGILNSPKSEEEFSKNDSQKCSMGDLPEGRIGTLQIMKSNRLRLVLGECVFWLQRGVPVPFREELALVNADPETKTGDIVSLGDIKERIYAVPENVTKFADGSVTKFANDDTC